MSYPIKLTEISQPLAYAYDKEELQRLKSSIQDPKIGLMHPIILKGEKPPYEIIAGRARFIAHFELSKINPYKFSTIQATIYPSTTSDMEISLQENLRRNNLSWYEQ